MANIERWGISWLQVVLDGSSDWTCSRRIKLRSLKFQPSEAGDVLVVKQATAGPETEWPQIRLESPAGEPVGCLFMSAMPAVVKIPVSLCTFADPSKVIVTFEYE